MNQVSTWADGFGIWHARVSCTKRGDHIEARQLARLAIIDELSQREGPRFDPSTVRVSLACQQRGYEYHYVEISDDRT